MSNYFTEEHDAWLIQRKGKITSSEYWKLTTGGARPMTESELKVEKEEKGRKTTVPTLFGDGAMTYIRSRITEMQSGEPKEEMDFKQTDWGKNNELDAKTHFETITGFTVVYHGISCPKFYSYEDFAGGSPDGEIIEPDAVLELKCPYNEDIHTKRLLIKTLDQFKKEEKEAWNQLQMNMLIMNKDLGFFGSYDPRRKDQRLMMKIVKVPADLEWIEDFKVRYNAAVEIMADILESTDKYLII